VRGLTVFDATCPLVTKVHVEVARQRRHGTEVVLHWPCRPPGSGSTLGQAADGMYLVENVEDVAQLSVRDPKNLSYATPNDSVAG